MRCPQTNLMLTVALVSYKPYIYQVLISFSIRFCIICVTFLHNACPFKRAMPSCLICIRLPSPTGLAGQSLRFEETKLANFCWLVGNEGLDPNTSPNQNLVLVPSLLQPPTQKGAGLEILEASPYPRGLGFRV